MAKNRNEISLMERTKKKVGQIYWAQEHYRFVTGKESYLT